MADFKQHIIPHSHVVTKADRVKKNDFQPKVIWFTGLSGSGKSTLASGLEKYLHEHDYLTYILDGDNVRKGLNKDLDFTDESRKENIRRIAEVANLFVDAGIVVLTAFISPFESERQMAKKLVGAENLIEVYVDCPLDVCEARDVKGLYQKARAGEIQHFTGISSPFEVPKQPNIRVNTANDSYEKCLNQLIEEIKPKLKIT